jgi:hypothetical protein
MMYTCLLLILVVCLHILYVFLNFLFGVPPSAPRPRLVFLGAHRLGFA